MIRASNKTLAALKPACRRHLDPRQLRIGRRIEMEHTDDPRVADRIARHHICEFPDAYTRIIEMERAAKAYWRTHRR